MVAAMWGVTLALWMVVLGGAVIVGSTFYIARREAFLARFADGEATVAGQLAEARARLDRVEVPAAILSLIARILLIELAAIAIAAVALALALVAVDGEGVDACPFQKANHAVCAMLGAAEDDDGVVVHGVEQREQQVGFLPFRPTLSGPVMALALLPSVLA